MKTCTKIFSLVICIFINLNCMAGESQFVTAITPERQKEFLIERDLGKAITSWLADNNTPAALECDKLVDKLLALREPTARTYFLEAQVAYLRQNSKKAISALQKAIEKYPNDNAPIGIKLPNKIVGRLWIANFAKQSGDIKIAQQTYEDILSLLGGSETINGVQDKGGLIMVCHLYLAELESELLKNNTKAISHLKTISEVTKPAKMQDASYDLYKSWANFESKKISVGNEKANLEISPVIKDTSLELLSMQYLMFAEFQLTLNFAYESPLAGCCEGDRSVEVIRNAFFDHVIKNNKSSIDESIVRLVYGNTYQKGGKYSEAEKHYTQLFNKDTFLSPIAGIYLAQCKKSQNNTDEANKILDQVNKKYPGYEPVVKQVRQSLK
jgi:tetratricopeptide (TPR) repeat protein